MLQVTYIVLSIATFTTHFRRQSKGGESHEMGVPSSTEAMVAVQGDSNSLHDLEKPVLPPDAELEKAMEASVIENPQTVMTSI